ncbi:MAG: diguanylate cyclase domain-containing protein [Desulfomonilia bacterium]
MVREKTTGKPLRKNTHRSRETEDSATSRFQDFYRYTTEFLFEHELDGRFTRISAPIIGQLGYTRNELLGMSVTDLMPEHHRRQYKEYRNRLVSNTEDEGLFQVLSKQGVSHILEYKTKVVKAEHGRDVVRGIATDVTERLRTEQELIESEIRFRSILESIEDGYFEVDLEGNFTFFNYVIPEHLGYNRGELTGMNYKQYMDEENAKIVFDTFHSVFMTGKSVKSIEWELIRKDSTGVFVEASVSLQKNRRGEPIGFQGIIRDITDRKRVEQKLAFMAYHDPLTGLYNRKAFLEKIREALKDAQHSGTTCSIMYIDLDKFKKVNDVYGHEAGDKLLVEVAHRLRSILRENDFISRMGGDEFTIILCRSSRSTPEMIAQRIVQRLSMPYRINSFSIDFVTPSIGISVYPNDGTDVETLIKNADVAMYKAKEEGNRYILYTSGDALLQPSV